MQKLFPKGEVPPQYAGRAFWYDINHEDLLKYRHKRYLHLLRDNITYTRKLVAYCERNSND